MKNEKISGFQTPFLYEKSYFYENTLYRIEISVQLDFRFGTARLAGLRLKPGIFSGSAENWDSLDVKPPPKQSRNIKSKRTERTIFPIQDGGGGDALRGETMECNGFFVATL